MHRHLRRAVNLEPGVHALNQADDPDVLYDRRVDSAIDSFAQKRQSFCELGRLYQRIEREVDANPARMREPARNLELVEGELRSFVTRIETLSAEVHGVRAIGDGRTHRVERSRRRKEL